MMCYRDITFCSFYLECREQATCVIALTPDVKRKAREAGLLISGYVDIPNCFKRLKRKD